MEMIKRLIPHQPLYLKIIFIAMPEKTHLSDNVSTFTSYVIGRDFIFEQLK